MTSARIAAIVIAVVIAALALPSFDTANEVVSGGHELAPAVLAAAATVEPRELPSALPTVTAVAPSASEPTVPASGPPATANAAPVDETTRPRWLTISRIGVSAPVVFVPLREDGTMPAPSGPREVASYSFAANPGETGNVVLAGHVDFANYGAAVFYRLRELQRGDDVVVTRGDGAVFTYRVSSVLAYEESTAPVTEILGPTDSEVLTLITCTGTFSAQTRSYDQRLVVRADRVG